MCPAKNDSLAGLTIATVKESFEPSTWTSAAPNAFDPLGGTSFPALSTVATVHFVAEPSVAPAGVVTTSAASTATNVRTATSRRLTGMRTPFVDLDEGYAVELGPVWLLLRVGEQQELRELRGREVVVADQDERAPAVGKVRPEAMPSTLSSGMPRTSRSSSRVFLAGSMLLSWPARLSRPPMFCAPESSSV